MGLRSELYYGAQLAFEQPFHSPRPLSGFVTGEQGIGHVVLAVENLEDAMRFYRDALGMRESDFIDIRRGDTAFRIGFLHCNPRAAGLALAEVKGQTASSQFPMCREMPIAGPNLSR